MSKELEKIKELIKEHTAHMGESTRAELLDNLAWWASQEAGSLDFGSPDAEDYDN